MALALLAGCGEPARVGAIVSRSGAAASYGEHIARGFDLAVEQINASGGVAGRKLELLYRDDSTNPDVGLSALRELVEIQRIPVIHAGELQTRIILQRLCVELGDVATPDEGDVHACARPAIPGPAAA